MNKFNQFVNEMYNFFWRIKSIILVLWQCVLIFLFTLSFKCVDDYLKKVSGMLREIKEDREVLLTKLISARDEQQKQEIIREYEERKGVKFHGNRS